MNIKKIENLIQTIIENKEYELFSIKPKKEFGEDILEILIDGENITTDILEEIHVKLLESLAEGDLPDNYYLEIATVGIERPIRNFEEMTKAVSKYIYIESEQFKGNGTLEEINEDTLKIKVNIKGQIKIMTLQYSDIKFARHAVKF